MTRALALAAALLCAAAALPARADETPTRDRFKMSLGYDGRLGLFAKVLDVQVEQSADLRGFGSTVRLKSSGLLAAFKKIDQRAETRGRIVAGDARPFEFAHDNPGAKKYRRVEVRWEPKDVVTTANPTIDNWGDPPATRIQKLEAADPLTQLMRFSLADSQAEACHGSLHFFDGKQLYAFDFSNRAVDGQSPREKKLGLINPVRCQVQYREVAGFKRKPPEKRNQGLKGPISIGFAQVGQNGPWVISFLDADTSLGHANIALERLNVAGRPPE